MTQPVFRSIADLRAQIADWKGDGARIGLVATMGALHDGHLSLIEAAKADKIIVSIFVNPTQFAAHEDFDTYPRDEAADFHALAPTAAAAIFAPEAAEIYPEDFATDIQVGGAAEGLEAAARPHFFGGVALAVVKLLMQTQADCAVFGEKDYQQLCVIRQIVRDLNIPTDVIAAPTIREADGLAMSSRNAYLDPDARRIAGQLNVILRELAENHAEEEATRQLLEAGFDAVDYAVIREAETLRIPDEKTAARRALIAARLGKVRLLDNMAAL